jgi:hypothetical protein
MLNCSNNSQPYAFHNVGANFALGDAAVRFVDEGIDPNTFISLFTLAGGEVATLD